MNKTLLRLECILHFISGMLSLSLIFPDKMPLIVGIYLITYWTIVGVIWTLTGQIRPFYVMDTVL